ncbi:MAG: bifunctional DNA primase/helicase [Rikenellaceae bacterium]
MEILAKQKATPYTLETKGFTTSELEFWQQWGVDASVLERFNVISIAAFGSISKEGKPYRITPPLSSPMFGYQGNGYAKLYSPFETDYRFRYVGEKSELYCFGLEQLPSKGDVLYITGGEKDVLSLSARGFNAICFNSESAEIPAETIKRLSFMFKYIVLLFDMDKTGLECSERRQEELADFGVLRLLLPLPGSKQAKDISDYFKLGNSVSDFRELLLELLEPFYTDTLLVLKSCEVNLNKQLPESRPIVSANGVPLATQGNLFCISGGEGTGKSNFIGSMIAGCLNVSGDKVDTLGFDVTPNAERKAILLYDTEQSEAQLYKNSRNILRRCNLEDKPSYFKAYSLTSMSREERLQSIKSSMDRFHHLFGGVHLVVIDGVADLVRSANDESESIAVVEDLYRLAGMYNTCIVCILHFVPNGVKLRGHLGSEIQRKAAAIISIERDSNPAISVVKTLCH